MEHACSQCVACGGLARTRQSKRIRGGSHGGIGLTGTLTVYHSAVPPTGGTACVYYKEDRARSAVDDACSLLACTPIRGTVRHRSNGWPTCAACSHQRHARQLPTNSDHHIQACDNETSGMAASDARLLGLVSTRCWGTSLQPFAVCKADASTHAHEEERKRLLRPCGGRTQVTCVGAPQAAAK